MRYLKQGFIYGTHEGPKLKTYLSCLVFLSFTPGPKEYYLSLELFFNVNFYTKEFLNHAEPVPVYFPVSLLSPCADRRFFGFQSTFSVRAFTLRRSLHSNSLCGCSNTMPYWHLPLGLYLST